MTPNLDREPESRSSSLGVAARVSKARTEPTGRLAGSQSAMNERIFDRSPSRSPVTLPSVFGIVALSILSATPPVGASGGNIDNDSPYNMPTFGDSSGSGGGSGASGGGAKVYGSAPGDRARGFPGGNLAKLLPVVEVGASFTLIETLASTAYAVVPGAKIAAPGEGNPSGPTITLQVQPGEQVFARDSSPFQGDDTVEVQGSFSVRGAQQLFVSPNKELMPATGFLLLGDSSGYSPTGIMAQIDQIVPLGPSGSSVDIGAIAGGLAKMPQLLGRDAQVIVGHKKWTPGVGVVFHVDATVDFEVAVRPTFEIDTDPEFDA